MLREFISRFLRSNERETPAAVSSRPGSIMVVGQSLAPLSSPETSTTSLAPDPYKSITSAEEWLKGALNSHVPSDLLHPEKEGLEPVSASELMDANRIYIEQTLQSFTHKHFIPDFDTHLLELIRRVAHWMGPFPASRGHHHSNRGGLFTHSIGVALSSLHMSVGKNVTTMSSPRERDADGLAWQLICFICGLLHDIGKLNTTGRVYALSVAQQKNAEGVFVSSSAPVYSLPWQPMVEGFEGWAVANKVQSYFLDFDIAETLPHKDFAVRYVMAIVPRPLLAYIYNSAEMVRSLFEDFIRNPESAAQTPIFVVVRDADHMNVAQSMDPRRRPGSAEMGSLIIRRFNEYASESRWNLPSSPFIYAHVERETDEGYRYYGMPFFVASETAINEFIHYLTTKPLLGVGFGPHIREIVFKTLESAYVMNRVVEPLLPEQIQIEELQDYVPASKATVRFRANDVDTVIKPIGEKHADAIIEMAVIAVNLRPAASVMLNAPTLSFAGTPSSSTSAAVPLTVTGGKATPQDAALCNDREYVVAFARHLGITVEEAEALFSLKAAKQPIEPDKPKKPSSKLAALSSLTPGAGAVVSKPPEEEKATAAKSGSKAAKKPAAKPASKAAADQKPTTPSTTGKKSSTSEDAKPKDKAKVSPPAKTEKSAKPAKVKGAPADKAANIPPADAPKAEAKAGAGKKKPSSATPSDAKPDTPKAQGEPGLASAPSTAKFEQNSSSMPYPPEDAPEWMHAYRALFDMPSRSVEKAFWGVLWLYLRTHNKHSIQAVEDGKGGYGLRGTTIPKAFRGEIIAELQGAKMLIAFVSTHWGNQPLRLDSEKFAKLYTVSTPEEGITLLDLGVEASALIRGAQKSDGSEQGAGEAEK